VFNRKPLPLPWIQVEDRVPVGLETSLHLPGGYQGSPSAFQPCLYSAVNWKPLGEKYIIASALPVSSVSVRFLSDREYTIKLCDGLSKIFPYISGVLLHLWASQKHPSVFFKTLQEPSGCVTTTPMIA
jgi:hypothetical protein